MPPRTITAPLEISVLNEAGLLTFDLTLLWSLLAAPDSEAHKPVARALAQLVDAGWSVAD